MEGRGGEHGTREQKARREVDRIELDSQSFLFFFSSFVMLQYYRRLRKGTRGGRPFRSTRSLFFILLSFLPFASFVNLSFDLCDALGLG